MSGPKRRREEAKKRLLHHKKNQTFFFPTCTVKRVASLSGRIRGTARKDPSNDLISDAGGARGLACSQSNEDEKTQNHIPKKNLKKINDNLKQKNPD